MLLHARRLRSEARKGNLYGLLWSKTGYKKCVSEELGSALSKAIHTPRSAILKPAKISFLLRAIDEYGGDISVLYALKIMPHVFVRSAELRGARWEEIDFDGQM